jgi:hypothetical protein
MTNPHVVRYLILAMCKFQHEWVGDHFNMLGPLCQVKIKVPPLHEVHLKLGAWTTKEFKMKQVPSYMTIESYLANQDLITDHIVLMSHDFLPDKVGDYWVFPLYQ